MHQRYGDIVRVAPDELFFAHPGAWSDIHKKTGKEMEKAPWFYRPLERYPRSLMDESHEQHGRLRRQMASGFSEKSMRDQEPIIRGYIDLLLQKLREKSNDSQPVVISDWFNYTTFDIIGDLAFGEPFECLGSSKYDAWIKSIFNTCRPLTLVQALAFYPWLKRIAVDMVHEGLREVIKRQRQPAEAKIRRRMAVTENRVDLMEGLLKKKDELNLGTDELVMNAQVLMIAGSETTASLLSGVTYLLLQNSAAYQQLVDEVRSTFSSEKEINFISVNRLSYMLACLNEALRMYPPVANGMPRVVPKGGAQILGQYIPEQTYVAIPQWALYRREEYFAEPNAFHPERFLGDSRFANDRRDALQPFSVGPRNCLGRNLAYAEMRLILALIIFNFDMKIDPDSCDWIQQKNFTLWQKPPLKVYLTPVARKSEP
ncbi:cytochrome P450 [Aspergillus novofumigatus IBT 16806]|uniref:Benzoate 4-monooxygenase cytochrome P450 n=1 Tax=Aspergillus novofumigatus (strain IBT 16806) TaxID=1392255 RepID=A0A2I1BYQ3_ASPN1|nr:benzoate 4-monooxygenase cytochrome P450 [Aspergillus novofumigatus IBT 16806]PKX90507.1 benzoate 4-monooxygenase cytochrome P450 [Aspergillus novofumigatus IBT 16806]